MSAVTITKQRAEGPRTCARCTTLGIREKTIHPGEHYFVFANRTRRLESCADCMERLREQCEEAEA